LAFGLPVRGQEKAPFKDLPSYVKWVQSKHKAPFDRDGAVLPPGSAKLLKEQAHLAAATVQIQNDRVNQDRNPWPKAEIAAAVDPTNGRNYLVMSNDFRLNFDHMFFHPSTDGGETFTDDAMVGGADPFTGGIPLTFQSDPGVSFDRAGNSYLSTISGNSIFDLNSGYLTLLRGLATGPMLLCFRFRLTFSRAMESQHLPAMPCSISRSSPRTIRVLQATARPTCTTPSFAKFPLCVRMALPPISLHLLP